MKNFWKKYYYNYLDSFLDFLIRPRASVLKIDVSEVVKNKKASIPSVKFDYIVASDALGHIDDIQVFMEEANRALKDDGRIIITQYNALWEPILRLASLLHLRNAVIEQNWLSMFDLQNIAYLSGLDTVKSGTKMIMPVYIPLISFLLNKYIANIWPFTRLGMFHYIVLRKNGKRFDNQNRQPSISIVVPARNEAGTIEKIARELPMAGSFTEIIFVEGNSTDNTWDEIRRVTDIMSKNVHENEHGVMGKKIFKCAKQLGKGKGDAVRKGFEMSTGDILTIYDADMTVPPEDMLKFYEAISNNKGDFINGSRLVYPMEKESMRILNFLGNKFFSLAFSWILGQCLKDTLCGTKVVWREDYEKIKAGRTFFGDFDPFGDFDLLFGAAKLNLKIVDLPIRYRERVYGSTNISRWKHGWLLLRMTAFAARKMKFT